MSEKQNQDLDKVIGFLTTKPKSLNERNIIKFITIFSLITGPLGFASVVTSGFFTRLFFAIYLGIILTLPFYFFVRKKEQNIKEKFFMIQLIIVVVFSIYLNSRGFFSFIP